MTSELWTFDELIKAAGGNADGTPATAITGFSIDTRSLAPGDVFVALKDVRDGHEFVERAFKAGAAAALVSKSYERKPSDGALVRVADPLAGLEAIGRAARARLTPGARVVAVTGSAGKTTTKEMLRAAARAIAPGRVHASDKSFNNHWGVPLTLARMPRDTLFAIFEIGMNHAGEITPLSRMVRPHVAVVTTVEAVHLAHFASVADIAEAKAEIFAGLEPGGTAVVPSANPFTPLLAARAVAAGARVLTCGETEGASVRLVGFELTDRGSRARISIEGRPEIDYGIGHAGRHNLANSTLVAGALYAAGLSGADLERALAALAAERPPPGRGTQDWIADPGDASKRVLLIDESYNANPASMCAALGNLALVRHWNGGPLTGRRIAVLGDMLELGPDAPALHAGLAEAVEAAGADLVFAAGPSMKHLFDALPAAKRGFWGADSKSIVEAVLSEVRPGDAVVIKGSNGSRMGVLVEALRQRYSGASASG